MKALRKFLMEDELEENRFHTLYNLGESGGRARTVSELLLGSDVTLTQASETFFNTKLCDSPNWGRNDLRQLIANMHPGTTMDNVLVTTGTSEALFLLFRHLNPKSVALAVPAFQLLYEIPMALNAQIVELPVRWDAAGKPFIDEQEWLQTIQVKKPECLLINNPHNPSGLILSECFMDKLHHVAASINCTIIGDEHYRFLSDPDKFLGPTLYRHNSSTFVTGSFIKCLGVPGLRMGWCVGPHKALSHLQNEKNYTTHTVNPITEWLSFEVLKEFNTPLFKTMKDEWKTNREILRNFLEKSQNIYGQSPAGGLVAALGFKHTHNISETQHLIAELKKSGVFVLPLETMEFGAFAFQQENAHLNYKLSNINKGFGFRLGLGCAPEKFTQALEVINKA